MSAWPIRAVEAADIPALVRMWHSGWHDGHAGVVPDALIAIRTFEDFEVRLPELVPDAMTAGPIGAPLGFCMVLEDEIYQFYVAAEARGTGLAAHMLAEGEDRIAAAGHATARLDVAIGNARAERFYGKCGFQAQGPVEVALKSSKGDFAITLLRMTKVLSASA